MAQALRIRDEAKERAQQLAYQHQQTQQQAQQAAQPRTDPRVVDYAKQWLDANPWYNPQGRDEDSAVTKAIDNSLAAEGWNPASEEYWHELTRRVATRIGDGGSSAQAAERTPRRKAPPTGNTREHTPTRTRNEVVVTPERKAAMIEAGIWDDPVRRTSQLKAYQAYDRENSAR
jgi:type II secretory pathway pseudopilin PulG